MDLAAGQPTPAEHMHFMTYAFVSGCMFVSSDDAQVVVWRVPALVGSVLGSCVMRATRAGRSRAAWLELEIARRRRCRRKSYQNPSTADLGEPEAAVAMGALWSAPSRACSSLRGESGAASTEHEDCAAKSTHGARSPRPLARDSSHTHSRDAGVPCHGPSPGHLVAVL